MLKKNIFVLIPALLPLLIWSGLSKISLRDLSPVVGMTARSIKRLTKSWNNLNLVILK